jgi:Ni,Fe-hydrogenase I large subunit
MELLNRKTAPQPAPERFSGHVAVDPVPRLPGPLRLACRVEGGRVLEAFAGVRMFRDLEHVLVGRPPNMAAHLVRRLSGTSPAAYGLGACMALENAWEAEIPAGARLVRNLALAAEMVQAHLTSFFLQDLPGLAGIDPLAAAPGTGGGAEVLAGRNATAAGGGREVPPELRRQAWEAARESVAARRACAGIVAALAGRSPHPPGIVPGGAGQSPDAEALDAVARRLELVRGFVNERWAPLAWDLAEARPELFEIGRGPGNFLSAGALPMNDHGAHFFLAAGVWLCGRLEGFRPELVTEHPQRCWLQDDRPARALAESATLPDPARPRAYTFAKAARYAGECCESGPLARAVVGNREFSPLARRRLAGMGGEKARRFREALGVMDSAMGRRLARAEESVHLCEAMAATWLDQLSPGEPAWSSPAERPCGEAAAWSESAEGINAQAVRLEKGRVGFWGILTGGNFNLGPRDQAGRPSALEQALVGCRVEAGRDVARLEDVARSFAPDPAAAAQ